MRSIAKFDYASGPNTDLLDSLGVRNSSVFLSNCTIWVEGITDRKYIKKYLDLYLKEKGLLNRYQENLHYSFLEYAGSNIEHFSFSEEGNAEKMKSQAISNRIF